MEDTSSAPLLTSHIPGYVPRGLVDGDETVDAEQYVQRPGQGPRNNTRNNRKNNKNPPNNNHPHSGGHHQNDNSNSGNPYQNNSSYHQNHQNHQNNNSSHHQNSSSSYHHPQHVNNNQNNYRPPTRSSYSHPNDTQSQNNQNRNNQTNRNNNQNRNNNNRNYRTRQNNESEIYTETEQNSENFQIPPREALYVSPHLRSANNRHQGQEHSPRHTQNHSPHHGQDHSPRHGRPTKSDDIGSFGGATSLRPDPGETTTSARQQPNSVRPPRAKKNDLKRLTQGHSELTSRMISELVDGTYECMVCVDKVGGNAAIWTCKYCFRLFHIGCIKKWRKSSMAQKDHAWVCPHCRHLYTEPPIVSCFCGKCNDAPTFDPYLLPHSCGEVCGKSREGTTCPHTCSLLCHPGPCPDCPALAPEKNCFCGKTVYCKRCGQEDPGQSCGQTCGQVLSCSRHYCTQTCHDGPCQQCKYTMTQKCYCGKIEELRVCGSESETDISSGPKDPRYFSCGKSCGRKLSCGNHFCQSPCHPSTLPSSPTCPPCALSPSLILTCPCGGTPITQFPPRKSCSDPIPTCDNICGKYLKCGQHKCRQKCHVGPCSEFCDEIVSVPCRCRNVMKQMKCLEVYPDKYSEVVENNLCKRLCVVMRECGRHNCNVPCCPVLVRGMDPDGYHVCRLSCPKKLNCGIHFCPLTCHKGRCPQPCLEMLSTEDRTCPCGRTTQYAPVTCGTPLPNCTFNCITPRACGHPMTSHLCHWTGDCPPCVVLVTRRCNGGHVILKSVPCNQVDASCGRECGKPMHCGTHHCTRKCHSGPCEIPLEDDQSHLLPEELETGPDNAPPRPPLPPSCGQRCKKLLPDCLHFCKESCHPGKTCPKSLCRQKSKITCSCGRLSDEVPCIGQRKIELPCDDVCRKELRSRQLAIAFGILPLSKPPQYSDFLLSMARATPHFIINLETKLNTFLRSVDMRLRLASMDTVQRKTIHELAKYYCLDDESLGSDPVRGVVLTKKTGSRIPTALLSQMAAVEDGGVGIVVGNGGRPTIRPASTLHLYELSPKVKNYHLETFLRPYEGDYVIQWIDDTNALAIFRQEHVMRKALGSLSGGLFKVKAYQDSNPESGDGNLVLSGISTSVLPSTYYVKSPKIPQKSDDIPPDYRQVVKGARVKQEPAPPPRKPWEKDPSINSYGALSNEFGEEQLLFEDEEEKEKLEKGSEKKLEKGSEKKLREESDVSVPEGVRENWEDD